MKAKILFFMISTLAYPLIAYLLTPLVTSFQNFRSGTDATRAGTARRFTFVYGYIFSVIITFTVSMIVAHKTIHAWWMGTLTMITGLLLTQVLLWGYEYYQRNKLISYTFYYNTGELQEKGKHRGYCSDKHGTVTKYYKNGTIQSTTTYKRDRVDGPCKMFYPNGRLKAKGRWVWNKQSVEEILDGKWVYYQESGKLDDRRKYKMGKLLSSENYTLFYNTEELICNIKTHTEYTGMLKKSAIVGSSLFPNLNDGRVISGYRDGHCMEYYNKGDELTPASDITYKNHRIEGKARIFHENGQLQSCMTYINGKLEGMYSSYYADSIAYRIVGQLDYSCNYVNDKREGTARWYYTTGELSSEQEYSNGLRNGFVKRYDKKGQLHQWEEYREDRKIETKKTLYYKRTHSLQL